jgi:hypothetical protein
MKYCKFDDKIKAVIFEGQSICITGNQIVRRDAFGICLTSQAFDRFDPFNNEVRETSLKPNHCPARACTNVKNRANSTTFYKRSK